MNLTTFQAQLLQLVRQSIQQEHYKNAAFLCQRLLADCCHEDIKILLADCYNGSGEFIKAYHTLRNCQSVMARYKFAHICLKLKKYREGDEFDQTFTNGAAGMYLYAEILDAQVSIGKKQAARYYSKALERNPSYWIAFEKLCKINPNNTNPDNYFSDKSGQVFSKMFSNFHKVKNSSDDVKSPHPFPTTQIIQNQENMHSNYSNKNSHSALSAFDQIDSNSFCQKQQQQQQQQQHQQQQFMEPLSRSALKSKNKQLEGVQQKPLHSTVKQSGNKKQSLVASPDVVMKDESSSFKSLSVKVLSNENQQTKQQNNISQAQNYHNQEIEQQQKQNDDIYLKPNFGQKFEEQGINCNDDDDVDDSHPIEVQGIGVGISPQFYDKSIYQSDQSSSKKIQPHPIINHHHQSSSSQSSSSISHSNQKLLYSGNPHQHPSSASSIFAAAPKINHKFNQRLFTSSKKGPGQNNFLSNLQAADISPFSIYQTPLGVGGGGATGASMRRGIGSAATHQNNLSFDAQPQQRSMNQKLVTPGSTRRNLLFSGSHKEYQNNYNRGNTYSGGGTLNSTRKVEAFASLVGVSGNNANGAGHSSASSSSLSNTFRMNTLPNISKGIVITDQTIDIIGLFNVLGNGYKNLVSLKSTQAYKIFRVLPKKQFSTAWVLLKCAQSFFDQGKYEQAQKFYEQAYRLQPYNLDGFQYYSTCLWQMKKSALLCNRAYQAIDMNPFSPSAWMAVGNSFSMQREHETAIKFFQRAIQLDKRCAYAYTLCGHQYLSNQDFQSAKRCYEIAMKCDQMHITAYWGLGNIYLKQEHFDKACKLFQKGIAINNRSPVLLSYLGVTYYHLKKLQNALECFLQAEKINYRGPLIRYQKCKVLVQLGRMDEAENELLKLVKLTPKEPPIHMELGDLYKKKGDMVKSAHHYRIYLDLDPKDQYHVKAKLERAHIDPESPEAYDI